MDFGEAVVIGAGQAGTAVALGLQHAGIPVTAIASRSGDSARRLAATLGAQACDPVTAASRGDLIILCVPDDKIAGLVEHLAQNGGFAAGHSGQTKRVVHCSGLIGLDALAPARDAGSAIGILHPVTPLVVNPGPAALVGKPMGCDAPTQQDVDWVLELAQKLGGNPVSLNGVNRVLYHAAASLSSNLVVGLCALSQRVFSEAGLSDVDAAALMGSLVMATASNIEAVGVRDALTGPIRRGDGQAIARHLGELTRLDPGYGDAYRALGLTVAKTVADRAAGQRAQAALEGK